MLTCAGLGQQPTAQVGCSCSRAVLRYCTYFQSWRGLRKPGRQRRWPELGAAPCVPMFSNAVSRAGLLLFQGRMREFVGSLAWQRGRLRPVRCRMQCRRLQMTSTGSWRHSSSSSSRQGRAVGKHRTGCSRKQAAPAWRQQQQDVQQQAEAARQRYNLAMQGMQQQQLTPEGTKVGEGRKRPCLVGRLHNLKPGLAYPVQLLRASRPAQRH